MMVRRGKGTVPLERGEAAEGQRPQVLYRWVRRLVSTALAIAWMGIIFHLSSFSPADLPRQIEAFSWLGKLRDVVGHLVLYGVLGPLLLVGLWSWVAGSAYRLRWALVTMGVGVLYGVTDEIHQSVVPGRSASAFDVLVDTVGVAGGVVCVWYVVRALRHRRAHGR